jgi:hypothetical protein
LLYFGFVYSISLYCNYRPSLSPLGSCSVSPLSSYRTCYYFFPHGRCLFKSAQIIILHLLQPYCLTPRYWELVTAHTLSYKNTVFVQPAFLNSWPVKMRRIGCPEMSGRTYHYSGLNSADGRSSRDYECFRIECAEPYSVSSTPTRWFQCTVINGPPDR